MDDQAARPLYAGQLGDEWTEVEPGIFVRVESDRRLQVVEPGDPLEDWRATKGAL